MSEDSLAADLPEATAPARTRFTTAILKLTATCNLNCTYCYMFNLADRTYHQVPAMMSADVARTTISRIRDYVVETDLPQFSLALHGGEPTLWPLKDFELLARQVQDLRDSGVEVPVTMQTNGLRLRPELLRLLDAYDIRVGVSVDGPARYNDRTRVTHGGRGSYARVARTVEDLLTKGYGNILSGFLCVADPDVPPQEFMQWAAGLPAGIDVLWPIQYHYGNLPWAPGRLESYRQNPRYGTWFSKLFADWLQRDPVVDIRLFEQSVAALLGSRRHFDALVNDRLPAFVVNTDGRIELNDYVRSYRDGGAATPYNILNDDILRLEADREFRFFLELGSHLPLECGKCPVVDLCGGGFVPGRMDPSQEVPSRRSVLCYDQYYFFDFVRQSTGPLIEALRPVASQ
ncbi:radical SAM protein [Kitasatospora purpeofusca]|uniref:radical SAM protein n=1 Tax=Kitasatospora purpeofusca TaxID=67352 RepID=UPI0030F00FA2